MSEVKEIQVFGGDGKASGSVDAPQKLVVSNAKMALIHQVAVAEMAGRRQGTHKTKRRDEVRGSNVKIRRQKGTGRSRQGDKRVPHMRGGGVVHGPVPRDYSENTPRKMRQTAFRTALNSRLQNSLLFVFDAPQMETPKTKTFVGLVSAMNFSGKKLLFLTGSGEENLTRSARNVPKVTVQSVGQTGITDVLRSEVIVCTRLAWEEMVERVNGKGAEQEAA